MPNQELLVVDDESGIRALVRDVGEELGFTVQEAADSDCFRRTIQETNPAIVVLDLVLPGIDGVELLRELAESDCTAKVLLMSGMDNRVLATAQRLGTSHGVDMLGVLHKPMSIDDLKRALVGGLNQSDGTTADELRAALEARELVVHYQPKISLRGDHLPITGAEALVRWRHPLRGLVPPNNFLPIAEESDLIAPLTSYVLEAALFQLGRWQEFSPDSTIAVNLSPLLLTDLELPDRIAAMLTRKGVDPQRLVLEITESAAMGDGPDTSEILARFRLKGIGLSLDDFGTGYSSLVQLYRMPFSELKIDRSFVLDLGTTDEAQTIVRSIIDLARNLGLQTCAEGVESHAVVQTLRSMGCDSVQGFLFSKPLTGEELISFSEDCTSLISRYLK